MVLKFCPRCGGQLEENVDFCNYCGEDLKERKLLQKNLTLITPEIPQKTVISTPTMQKLQKDEKNETMEVEYASFMPRFFACLIDVIILGVISFFHIALFSQAGPIILIAIPLIWFFYFWLLESFNGGRTIGKMALKLRTVEEQTLKPTKPGNYLLNNLLKPIPVSFLIDLIIGFIVNMKDPKKRRRIMQNASKTVVIKIRK